MLTGERLRELLQYDPETGIFIRKTAVPGSKIGQEAGYKNIIDGYVRIMIDRTRYPAHHLAWFHETGEWPRSQIDHINGIRDDNRICNLRPATQAQNTRNSKRHRDSSSGFKGVSFHKHSCLWFARVNLRGRSHSLGYFRTPQEAHAAYCAAAERLHGEFARFE